MYSETWNFWIRRTFLRFSWNTTSKNVKSHVFWIKKRKKCIIELWLENQVTILNVIIWFHRLLRRLSTVIDLASVYSTLYFLQYIICLLNRIYCTLFMKVLFFCFNECSCKISVKTLGPSYNSWWIIRIVDMATVQSGNLYSHS